MKKNYYQNLHVDPNADVEIIEVAYKRLARKSHPDTNSSPNATAQMQEINEAYATLKDAFKRSQYDAEFLPKLKQSTKSESKNTKENRKTEESIKKTQTASKPSSYKTSEKNEPKQYVETSPDKVRYEEWAKRSRSWKTESQQESFQQTQQKSRQPSRTSKNVKEVAISIIIFNILPIFYLVYAFDKQMALINTSSDSKFLEGAWFNRHYRK